MSIEQKAFILSDGAQRNSKGFRVALAGGRFERFDANPVMLYDHDTKLVIGRWENRRVEENRLVADPVFDLKDEFAAEKARKIGEGFLRGASIGIIPLNLEEINGEFVMTDWELLEASITPIPSDAGAVRLYNEKSEVITFEQLKLSLTNTNKTTTTMDTTAILLTAATCDSLGLSSSYTAKQIELAVSEKDAKIDKLTKDVKELKAKEVTTYLSQAVKDGKIDAKEVTAYTTLGEANFEQLKAIIDAKPVTASASLRDMTKKTDLSTSAERASWSYIDWMKKDSKGLERLKHDDPDAFEKLKNTLTTEKQ